jgi:siroheme synthase
LQDLPGQVAGADIKAPTLIIVGEVVQLHAQLAWFEPAGQRTSISEV